MGQEEGEGGEDAGNTSLAAARSDSDMHLELEAQQQLVDQLKTMIRDREQSLSDKDTQLQVGSQRIRRVVCIIVARYGQVRKLWLSCLKCVVVESYG